MRIKFFGILETKKNLIATTGMHNQEKLAEKKRRKKKKNWLDLSKNKEFCGIYHKLVPSLFPAQ